MTSEFFLRMSMEEAKAYAVKTDALINKQISKSQNPMEQTLSEILLDNNVRFVESLMKCQKELKDKKSVDTFCSHLKMECSRKCIEFGGEELLWQNFRDRPIYFSLSEARCYRFDRPIKFKKD